MAGWYGSLQSMMDSFSQARTSQTGTDGADDRRDGGGIKEAENSEAEEGTTEPIAAV